VQDSEKIINEISDIKNEIMGERIEILEEQKSQSPVNFYELKY